MMMAVGSRKGRTPLANIGRTPAEKNLNHG